MGFEGVEDVLAEGGPGGWKEGGGWKRWGLAYLLKTVNIRNSPLPPSPCRPLSACAFLPRSRIYHLPPPPIPSAIHNPPPPHTRIPSQQKQIEKTALTLSNAPLNILSLVAATLPPFRCRSQIISLRPTCGNICVICSTSRSSTALLLEPLELEDPVR